MSKVRNARKFRSIIILYIFHVFDLVTIVDFQLDMQFFKCKKQNRLCISKLIGAHKAFKLNFTDN